MKKCTGFVILLLSGVISFSQLDSIIFFDYQCIPEKGKVYLNSKKLPKELKTYIGEMCFIPLQTFEYGQFNSVDDTWDEEIKVGLSPFYISATEVTNKLYREFCTEMGDKYLPDTTVWRSKLGYYEPYVELYFRHPAYDDYPVMGVSVEKAKAYCDWLTAKVKSILEKYPDLKEKLVIKDFRLPSSYEWECAARGGDRDAIYSFGKYFYYVDRHRRIQPYANFKDVRDESRLKIEGMPEDLYDVTAPVMSFKPNPYGLYNMSGNVAELTLTEFPESILKDLNRTIETENIGKYIIKGGSWSDTPYYLRITARKYMSRDEAARDTGFRVAMSY